MDSVGSTSADDTASIRNDTALGGSWASIKHNNAGTTLPDDSGVEQATILPTKPQFQSRRLVSGALPLELQALLDEWYLRRASLKPPPCAMSGGRTKAVHKTHSGKPARYEHKDGEKLEVVLYTLPELEHFKEKHVMVVQGPTKGPFIVSFLNRLKRVTNAVPYFVWEGVRSNDEDGWERDPSVRKFTTPNTKAEPKKPGTPDDNAETEDDSDDSEAEHLDDNVKTEADAQPGLAQEDDWQYSPEPEQQLSTIPQDLRIILNKWYSHKGSKQPPPCAMEYSKTKYLNTSKRGNPCTFTHCNGLGLTISVCALPEFVHSSVKAKHIIVAKATSLGPFIIGFVGGRSSGPPVPYHIWEGFEAKNPDGWEEKPSIHKQLSRRSGGEAAKRLVEHSADSDHADESEGESISHASELRTQFSASSKLEQNIDSNSQIASNASRSNDITNDNPMPENIRQVINEWCDREGPSYKLDSLPCATITHYNTLSRSSGGRPVAWEHVNGEKLKVSMYPLRGTVVKYGAQDKNIVVAQGQSLKPCLISYVPGGANTEMVRFRIWKGIEGDKDGYEQGYSVKKIFLAKSATGGKTTPKNKSVPLQKRKSLPRFPKTETDEKYIQSDLTTRKRKRPDDDLDSSLIIGQSPSKQLRTRNRDSSTTTRPSPLAIKNHIQNNAVFLFYSQNSETPRVRLLSACDTVQKLFAQAIAGDLFDDTGGIALKKGGGGKVLSIRFGCIRKETEISKNISVVEEDEEDFEALIRAIEARDWWFGGKSGDLVEGSGTVEVRAKR
jgi:hypothetical protein